mmetsp:Transcript_13180/g.19388  ORF Transcript_13180/g.19388 Transcript_13180/m.19388 type:complete len:640 (+) Transcript_13180:175-2094(+)
MMLSNHAPTGMSRAAKKRAQKKQKKERERKERSNLKEKTSDETHASVDDPGIPAAKRKLQSELNPLEDKKKHAKIDDDPSGEKDVKNIADIESDETNEKVDDMVLEVVSKLNPAQILLRTKLDEDKTMAKIGSEEIDLSDLLQEISSKERARCLLQSILGSSVTIKQFYEKYWEREPLLVNQQSDPNRLNGFLSLEGIRKLTKSQCMAYGKDLNVTRYEQDHEGVKRRHTLDQTGKGGDDFVIADHKDLWSNYDNGCTIRLLCPHQHSEDVHALLSTLELEWGCMVGANAYLTPPGAFQGFSPHYDDVCAFVLQLEGKKHWKVYRPKISERLPRVSSKDYTEDEIKDFELVLDVILEKGDLLYMPRGWIHQACTLPCNDHSLHLTVSIMQQWSWVDYLELLLPVALQAAASSETSTSLREGLPRNFLDYMGVVHDQPDDPEELKSASKSRDLMREATESEDPEKKRLQNEKDRKRLLFLDEAKKRIMRVSKEAFSMVDAACDEIGKRFLSDRLPPALTPAELSLTVENKAEVGRAIFPNTMCRLVRPGIARLAIEDGKAVLYHCIDNSLAFHEAPLSPLEFEMDDAPAVEALLTTVEPHWVMVKDLIHDDIEDKVEIVKALYDEGILATLQAEKPDRIP